jgi:hypothetical protein
MSQIKISPLWRGLSVFVAGLVAVASAAGIFLKTIYSQETASYAAQGVGQDIVNLAVAVPVLLTGACLLRKGSVRALLVWLGGLVYIVYSYLMYAFSVHFGPLFPVYVAILGVSFYTLFGSLFSLKLPDLAASFSPRTEVKPASAFLMIFGALFFVMWSKEIFPAVLSGTVPQSVTENGLPVNFVHVLDLGFVLPGMIATSVLLWKKQAAGYLFAVPLLMFAAIMGLGILSMLIVMSRKGVAGNIPFGVIVAIMVTASVLLTAGFLKGVERV